MASSSTRRSVWIFARPLSASTLFPSFTWTSHGRLPLCHWGVLVSPLENHGLRDVMLTGSVQSQEDPVLGTMWELHRIERTVHTVHRIRPFKLSTLRVQWAMFWPEWIGMTSLNDQEIQTGGIFLWVLTFV